ncbi:hypothetical protein D9611_001240 [Ephemerocybe angulata]|uniref:Uncharacterized protein n=1 Tax=Ephemerocybe angulata TaxID=980116 RepID=A0A8H5CKN1_9AGAR|nr:hypothetical protein D9611_001240 [Tulosesus angulatus]
MQSRPIIDIQNPFYCPALSAVAFLNSVRHSLLPGHGSNTFVKMLDQPGSSDSPGGSLNFVYDSENDWIVGGNPANKGRAKGPTTTAGIWPMNLTRRSAGKDISNSPSMDVDEFTLSVLHPKYESTAIGEQNAGKRKRDSTSSPSDSSDLQPVAKYAKSVLLANDSSFELEVQHERVNFDATGSPTLHLEDPHHDSFKSTMLLDPTLVDIMNRVLTFLPGIRLEERLSRIPDLTVQKMAEYLAQNGYMNHCVLKAFRRSDITTLSLGTSLSDEDGLNICGQDVIKSLGKPGSFLHLTELSFSESCVEDFNLIYLHHLPKLSVLHLNNTGIGNEAVYLLVPLKRTLKRLSLATNPDITSESVPALLLLADLAFLSILDTGVDMDGLRLIAKTILEEGRNIDIEIPYACENYIDNLESMYLVDIQPPLVSSPDDCSSLTVATLKKNLAAHSEKNPRIMVSGTRAEMIARLQDLLTKRQMDLVVAQMLLGP